MAFDAEAFAAKIVLGELPAEAMPAAAQDAMEAGFDGPAIVRLAILEQPVASDVEPLLPQVFAELGVVRPTPADAALYLAKLRARQILDSGEDPLPSLNYFCRLAGAGGWPDEISELGWLEDAAEWQDADSIRAEAHDAMACLLDPVRREQRRQERLAAWAAAQERRAHDWPYKLNCPRGRSEYWRRWREHWSEMPRWLSLSTWALYILFVLSRPWRTQSSNIVATTLPNGNASSWLPIVMTTAIVLVSTAGIYSVVLWRQMRYEVQARRWRDRIDVDTDLGA